ncbi:site-specific integrase [Pelotomaculum isophthalicicum JI]|uniref:Site-specific integrase n=1 Tax=Pelotomaculum isophthalicicum JI TaxID=947010 RepID=A0A9X4H2Q2_9FIRM|nr:site-specific integrase [Pelotomaculum isophthalicicum]MDF9409066.1 site-specific integrase [Pelotomaculum isophthalicicum JI]
MAKKTKNTDGKKPRKPRNANGEGGITQLKNGLWQARMSVRDPITGDLKRYAYYGKSKIEARDKLIKAQNEIRIGSFVVPQKDHFGTWLTVWLTQYKKIRVRASTFALYDNITKTHIIPNIGDIPLQKLETKDIQKIINTMRKEGKSVSHIKHVHLIISGALKQAVKEQKVFRNVADAVELPKGEKKKVAPMSKDDAKKFLEVAKKSKYYPAFVLEIGTGLRRGELLALRWKDIDLDKGTLTVNQALSRVALPDKDKKTQLMFQAPKTEKGKRVIKLKNNVIKTLKAHQLATGNRDNPDALVFSNKKGRPLDPRAFTKRYEYILTKAGIPKTSFHALRHTVAVLLIQAGEKVKNVQELLGHERYGTTMDIYAEFMPEEEKDKTAEKIDALLEELM